jgi:hypothetical protein
MRWRTTKGRHVIHCRSQRMAMRMIRIAESPKIVEARTILARHIIPVVPVIPAVQGIHVVAVTSWPPLSQWNHG